MRLPVVAIVGRPNVGKSTLFNRLAGRRISIVEDLPGVTRDRIYAEGIREDDDGKAYRFTLIDTGGFEIDPSTPLLAAIKEQTQLAIDEADVVVLVVDARAGVMPDDTEVGAMLRKSNRPVVVAANKADTADHDALGAVFYELGVKEVVAVSASHGRGGAALLDRVFEMLPKDLVEAARAVEQAREDAEAAEEDEALWDDALAEAEAEMEAGGPVEGAPTKGPIVTSFPEVLRICVVGRPNAGKSSFINKLLGEDRHLVSDIPGTTVDAVDSFLEYGGTKYRLIDTAGIRRKRSISLRMEKYAVVAALKAMDRADVALLLLDASEGLKEQDLKIAAFAADKGRAVVVVVNKWDLAKENELDAEKFTEDLKYKMPFLDFAPVRFVSAKTGKRVHDVLETATSAARSYFTRVSTSEVNRAVQRAQQRHQPPGNKGKRAKLLFGTQVKVAPPTFVIATNEPDLIHFSYRRYMLNSLRESFGFEGSPIRIFYRRREKRGLKK